MRLPKLLYFTSICLLAVFFSSCKICSKKVTCPLFWDDVLTIWFPQQDKEQMRFIADGTGEVQTFTFDTIRRANDPDKVWQDEKDHCTATRSGASVEKQTNGRPKFSFTLIKNGYYDASVGRGMNMHLLGLDISSTDVRDDEFRQLTTPVANTYQQKMPSVSLAGQTFYDILQIRMDTAGAVKPAVHKLYFSRQSGLVAFETYSPSQRWVRQLN